MKRAVFALALAGAATVAAPVLAHHSGAMFDRTKQMTLIGTLKQVEWVSPHAWIHIDVPDASGKTTSWAVEMGGGPGSFQGIGVTRSYPKVGDKISIVAYPLRDGRPGASFVRITLPDGRVMGAGASRPAAAPPR